MSLPALPLSVYHDEAPPLTPPLPPHRVDVTVPDQQFASVFFFIILLNTSARHQSLSNVSAQILQVDSTGTRRTETVSMSHELFCC